MSRSIIDILHSQKEIAKKFNSFHLKETQKQCIEAYYEIFISVLL